MSQKTTKRVFTRKSKLFLVLASMILALSCKNPLGDEGAGGGGSGGGQTITNEQGKVFPAWYLTAEQQEKHFSMGPTILFASSKNPVRHYRIPAIIVADNGNIIAFGDNRYNHGSDIGTPGKVIDVVYRVSKDGGKNWSTEKIIQPKSPSANMTGIDNKGDALVFKAKSGNLICMAVSGGGYASAGNPATPSRMVRSVSTDNGETWSNWEEVGKSLFDTMQVKYNRKQGFATSGRGLTLANGDLSAAMSVNNGSGQIVILYIYSTDEGKTWQAGGEIPASTIGVINEPKPIAELDNGNILMSVRNASSKAGQQGKARMYSISKDKGINWDHLKAWNEMKCGNIDAEGIVWTRNGIEDKTRILHIQVGPTYRNGLRLWLSVNQGQSWESKLQILQDNHGAGYSSLDVCGDGTVVTFAEEASEKGQYYDLVFRRYNMKAITQEVYKTEWYREIKTK